MKRRTKSRTALAFEASIRLRIMDGPLSFKGLYKYLIPVALIAGRMVWTYFHGGAL